MTKSISIIGTRGYPSYYGGFETAVRKLAPYLVDHDWEVTVYGREGSVSLTDPKTDLRVNSVMTWGINSRSLSTLSYGLAAFIDLIKHKPNVALIMNVANGYFLPFAKLASVPTVVNVDGMEWKRAKWGRLGKAVFKVGAKLTARWADVLVADSKEIGKQWKEEFGVDTVFIPYGGDEVHELEPPMGLVKQSYVLIVARFVPENSIEEFFAAVPEISSRYSVVLVGSQGDGGPFDMAASELQRRYKNVTWLGHVSDDDLLFSLWQNCGVYFHGHTVGGTNPALVQAMMLGAPIVAIDTVFSREVLGDDAGVFSERTPDAICSAVLRVMSNSDIRDRVSSNAIARAHEKYAWESINRAYDELVRSVVR